MTTTIYITRGDAGSLISRGLGSVYVWFTEPRLKTVIFTADKSPFSEEYDEKYGKLKSTGIIHKNIIDTWVYRENCDNKSSFGKNLVSVGTNRNIPDSLISLVNERGSGIDFIHTNFKDGLHTNHSKNPLPIIFGYDSPIAEMVWQKVCEEFGNSDIRQWKDEEGKEWWRFCLKIDVDIQMKH